MVLPDAPMQSNLSSFHSAGVASVMVYVVPPTAGVTADRPGSAPAAVVGARLKCPACPVLAVPATVNENFVAGSVNGAAFFTTFNDAGGGGCRL